MSTRPCKVKYTAASRLISLFGVSGYGFISASPEANPPRLLRKGIGMRLILATVESRRGRRAGLPEEEKSRTKFFPSGPSGPASDKCPRVAWCGAVQDRCICRPCASSGLSTLFWCNSQASCPLRCIESHTSHLRGDPLSTRFVIRSHRAEARSRVAPNLKISC